MQTDYDEYRAKHEFLVLTAQMLLCANFGVGTNKSLEIRGWGFKLATVYNFSYKKLPYLACTSTCASRVTIH